MTSLSAMRLEGTTDMLASAGLVAASVARRSSAAFSYRHTLTPRPDEVVANRALFDWGLQSRLLRIVEAYLEAPAGYDGPLLYHGFADGRHAGIRRWHRDREDARVLKIALYLNDVDDEGGPFEMLSGDVNRRARETGSGYASYTQAALEATFGAEAVRAATVSCPGPAGTLVFCDTAQHYHHGKPPTRAVRVATFFSYFSRRTAYPFMCDRGGLTARHRAVLAEGLPGAQRDAVLWREAIPLAERLIPINRVRV